MGWLAFNMCSHHNHSSSSLLILLHVLPLLYHAQLQSWVNLFFLFCFELKYKFYSKHTHTLYIWWSQGSNPQGGTLGEGVAPLDWMPNGLESTFLIIVKWVAGKTSGLFKFGLVEFSIVLRVTYELEIGICLLCLRRLNLYALATPVHTGMMWLLLCFEFLDSSNGTPTKPGTWLWGEKKYQRLRPLGLNKEW